MPFLSAPVRAEENQAEDNIKITVETIEVKPLVEKLAVAPPKAPEPPKPETPVEYVVVKGDFLDKIAKAHNSTWQRLWQKNTGVTNPDHIKEGDKLVIPKPDEVLAERALPEPVVVPQAVIHAPQSPSRASTVPRTAPVRQTPVRPQQSFGSGNTYSYGYCTWYVKNRRGSSLPNSLGNANTWYARARAQGMSVGSTPRAGAVGTTTAGALGHVVYVESVNANGTINISEMNYKGFGVISRRTTSASEFLYIY